jgi:hypothetical protein
VARFLLLMVLFTVIARIVWRFVEAIVRGATGGTAGSPQGGARRPASPAAVKMQQCPVCGTYVVPGKAISLVSGGQPVYFDTEKCRAEFQ